jgi:sugar phosphate isomerase/epimerase
MASTRRALAATDDREEFGIDFDPSHFAHQFLDSAALVQEFSDRIHNVHVKDSRKTLKGRNSIVGGRLYFGGRGGFRRSELVFEQAMRRSRR